jgi:hypothetical protein
MLRIDRDLAAEHVAPEHVGFSPLIHVGDMHELVVHQREHAFARNEGFERIGKRRDVDAQRVVRRRARAGVAVVAEILEQHIDLAVGCPAPDALLPRH